MKVIGKVKLARGEVAFYDEASRIHLTLSNPVAEIYDFTNTAAIKRAIKYRRLVLIEGTLSLDTEVRKIDRSNKINVEVYEKPVKKAKEQPAKVKEEPKVEVIKEEPKIEAIEEAVEEVIEVLPKQADKDSSTEVVEEAKVLEEVKEVKKSKKKASSDTPKKKRTKKEDK